MGPQIYALRRSSAASSWVSVSPRSSPAHSQSRQASNRAKVRFAPHPDPRLGWLEASIDTVSGRVSAGWYYEQEGLRFEIHTPVAATFERNGKVVDLKPGDYLFFE